MTTFRIDVVVDPRKGVAGARAVGKGLDNTKKKAKGLEDQIKKTLKFISVAFAIKELTALGDSFTNLQNRLRVVTDGAAELEDVTERLLQVANRSRSSFESTAELYSRMALATRELNLEGADLVEVTESINKAIILSGASAKEANNGLIQLSQGLASGRLTGDELRSTLEQLPVVADVIAKQMGVTRGELRALGAEGKITSIKIIRAFQNAQKELEQKFAKTVPTVSQSFVVLRNNVVAFVGRINEGTGILRGFGDALRFIGVNLAVVIKSLATLGVTLAAVKFAPAIQAFFQLQAAAKAGTVTILGSVRAIQQKAAFDLISAQTAATAAAAELAKVKALKATTIAEGEMAIATAAANEQLFFQTVLDGEIIALNSRVAASTRASAAAQTNLAGATAFANSQANIFTRSLASMKAGMLALTKAISANPIGIFVVALAAVASALFIFRNDIKLSSDGIATLGDLFAEFWSQLKVALSTIPLFFEQAFGGAFSFVADFIKDFNFEFQDLLLVPAGFVDKTIGLFKGLFNVIKVLFGRLPVALKNIFVKAVNFIIDAIEFIPRVMIGVIKTIGDVFATFIDGAGRGFALLGNAFEEAIAGNFSRSIAIVAGAGKAMSKAMDDSTNDIGAKLRDNILDSSFIPRMDEAGEEAGETLLNAFGRGIDSSTIATDFANSLLKGAALLAQDRLVAEAAKKKAEANSLAAKAAADRAEAIEKLLAPLGRENTVLGIAIREGSREAAIKGKLVEITSKLAAKEIKLNKASLFLIESVIRQNKAREENLALKQRLIPVEDELAERTRIANQAFAAGAISAQEYAKELRNIDLAAAEAGTSIGDGLTRGFHKARMELEDFASTAESILVDGMQGTLDAMGVAFQETFSFIAKELVDGETSWVSYRDTIKAAFRTAIDSILADLARLLAQKALLALVGGPAAGAVPIPAGADGGFPKANKPFLVGEKGPEIFTPGQSGSITPTDQTIEALAGGAGSGGETIVVQAPAPAVNIQTIVVDDPNKIPSGIESADGQQAVLNVINMNKGNVKRSLG